MEQLETDFVGRALLLNPARATARPRKSRRCP
ncbi:Uncharacterised protein [Vibrio cholerae]|nr:Uncharacterised protein [Vibrio cholerae]